MSTKGVAVTARQQFVCTAQTIADEINTYVQADAADGFVFALHLTPGGFDEFVEKCPASSGQRRVSRRLYWADTER